MRVEQEEVRYQARHAGVSTPDMDFVHEALNQQRQATAAMRQHAEDLAGLQRQHFEGMAAEQRAELIRLANAQQEHANRTRIAEEALSGLRDTILEDRNRLGRLAESQGVVHNHIDQSTVNNIQNNNTTNQQIVDAHVHNQVMNLMTSHAAQFGAYMEQHRLNNEQMMALLFEHLRRQQQPQPQITILRPDPPEQVVRYVGGGGPPPPPPGGAGAVRVKKKETKEKKERRGVAVAVKDAPVPPDVPAPPAPAPIPVPTPVVPTFDIGTPPPKPRSRSRGGEPAPKRRPRSRVPWTTGMVPEEAMIPAEPTRPRGRPRKRVDEELPLEQTGRPLAKAKARVRTVSVAETIAYPEEPDSRMLLPTEEEASRTQAQADIAKVKKKWLKPAKLAKDVGKAPKPKAKPKARATAARKVPEAAPQTGRKPRIKKVQIQSEAKEDTLPKRGRGRPKGSLGKKKLDALYAEELRRLAAVEA